MHPLSGWSSRRRSVTRRDVAEALHLLAMLRDDARDLRARKRVAPLVGAACAEESLALDRYFDKAVAPLHPGERGKTRMCDRARDTVAIGIEADQPGDPAESLRRLFQQVLIAQHKDARAFHIRPALHMLRPRAEELSDEQLGIFGSGAFIAEIVDRRI